MNNQSIITHKPNMYYVELREDYIQISKATTYKKNKSKASSECKALILAISEQWTNIKRGTGDLSFYMTYDQWKTRMYEMFSRPVIIDSINELLGDNLLKRTSVRYKGKDTFNYTLNYGEVNTRIQSLEDRDPHTTEPSTTLNPSTFLPVDSNTPQNTGKKVDGLKSLPVTGKKVDGDGLKSCHNVDTTQIPYVNTKRECVVVSTESKPQPTYTPLSQEKTIPQSPDIEEKKRLGKMAETIKNLASIPFVEISVLRFLDSWGKTEYGPCTLNKWEVSSAIAIVEQMSGTIEDALLIAAALKSKGKAVKIETVYNSWSLLKSLKKPKQSSTGSTDLSVLVPERTVSGLPRFVLTPKQLEQRQQAIERQNAKRQQILDEQKQQKVSVGK